MATKNSPNDDYNDYLKKIHDLEDELDEAEDSISDLTKEKKKLQHKLEELQIEYSASETTNRKIKEEIESLNTKNDFLQEDLQLKGEALDFITEILTAAPYPHVERTDSQIIQETDQIVEYLRDEVCNVLKKADLLPKENEQHFFGSNLDSWAMSRKKTWIRGKVCVAFVGEFSAGKTSIVNCILTQNDKNADLLPVSAKATTAIPTYISGGPGNDYSFVTPDNERKELKEQTFKGVSKEMLRQIKGASSLIQYFVMRYKNPHLEEMSILDTPGFNSKDPEDEKRTIGVINECDALFWVMDVNNGNINGSSLRVIKEHLKRPLFIVINKIDTKSKSEVEAVKKLFAEILDKEGVEYKDIIECSAHQSSDLVMKAIHKVERDTSRDTLLDDLVAFVESKCKGLEKTSKYEWESYQQVQAEYENWQEEFDTELERLEQYCEDLGDLPSENKNWWSENDYRMSKREYRDFKKLLDWIVETGTEDIPTVHSEMLETVKKLEESWKQHRDSVEKFNELSKCMEKLKAFAKKLNANNHPHSLAGLSADSKSTSRRSKANSQKTKTNNPDTSYHSLLHSSAISRKASEIMAPYVTHRRRIGSDVLSLHQIKVAWKELYRFIVDEVGYSLSEQEIKQEIPEYGSSEYVNEVQIEQRLRNILCFHMFRDTIYACSIGPMNIAKITKGDIEWDKLLYLLKERHGIEMKQWQFFAGPDAQATSLWNMIEKIQVKGGLSEIRIFFKD